MELIEIRSDEVTILQPCGRIDSVGSKPFGDRLAELVHSGSKRLLIDLGQIPYISSAGFRALLVARKLIDSASGKLVLCGMSAEVQRLFEIGAFLELFTVCASREDGLSQVRQAG